MRKNRLIVISVLLLIVLVIAVGNFMFLPHQHIKITYQVPHQLPQLPLTIKEGWLAFLIAAIAVIFIFSRIINNHLRIRKHFRRRRF